MPYIILKTDEGQVTLSPENIKLFEQQINQQIKNMTLDEMISTGHTLKPLLLNPVIAALTRLL